MMDVYGGDKLGTFEHAGWFLSRPGQCVLVLLRWWLLVLLVLLLVLSRVCIFIEVLPFLSLWTTEERGTAVVVVGCYFGSPPPPSDMSYADEDLQLVDGVFDGNFDVVKASLAAGVNVNGCTTQPYAPIVAAVVACNARMVEFLLEQGADPDRPVIEELGPSPDLIVATVGERALHIAARSGQVEIVRLLLKRSRADVNATGDEDCTPLMAAFDTVQALDCVRVVRLLLEAGADPTLAEQVGRYVPLHMAAHRGEIDLVDMLYSRAPTTLNQCTIHGHTPLYFACFNGHEGTVSKLLSLGAVQPVEPVPPDGEGGSLCPLMAALSGGFVDVVRVLVNEGRVSAIGGGVALGNALCVSVQSRQAKILRLLLGMDGEEKRLEWANFNCGSRHLLHYGAAFCCPATVSILLEAGADEVVRDSLGRIPRDIIGVCPGVDDLAEMDPAEEVAIRRMLQRGPAYRARSWAWPSDDEPDAGGSGGDETAASASSAAAAAVLPAPPAMKTPPVTGVRTFRPKKNNTSKLFVRLVGRYCAKD